MRLPPLLLLLVLLAGCAPAGPLAVGAAAVASGASLPVFHRTPLDMAVSMVSRRDCSIVNLDRGERYCRPRERLPETPVFCTRSLGVADCWEDPSQLPPNTRELADGPRILTPDQEAERTRRHFRLW